MRRKPTLVLISGAPGTGKTVLARRLAATLPVAVIEKDVIKETLFDTLGERDLGWSKRLGAGAFALLDMFVQSHLKAGQSIIAEAAFWREPGIVWLDRVKQRYNVRVLEMHCHAPLETVLQRVAGREDSDDRHRGHRSGRSIRAIVEEFYLLSTDEALELELLGPGPVSPVTQRRMGNYLALSAGSAAIYFNYHRTREGGRRKVADHGGLTPDEIMVPLIISRP